MAQPQGGFAEMQKSRVCTRRCRGVVGARFQGGRGLYPPTSAGTQVAGYLKAYGGWTLHTPALKLG